jgi:hypothetical protein
MVKIISPDEETMAPLAEKVLGLEFEGKFRKMICLGKKIQWKIGLPEPISIVVLIQKIHL